MNGLTSSVLRSYFDRTYTARHLVIVAVGNVTHEAMRDLLLPTFGALPASDEQVVEEPPAVVARALVRVKELEQSHVCLGTSSYPQNHDHRYALTC